MIKMFSQNNFCTKFEPGFSSDITLVDDLYYIKYHYSRIDEP